MVKKSILLLLFGFVVFNLRAQQTVMYTQYMFNGLLLNPAYAGSDKFLNVTMQGRQQWIGFNGAPTSQLLSSHFLLPNKKVGLGFLLERESMGVNQTFNGYFMYAYKIKINKGTLSMGLQAGVSNYQQRLTDLNMPQGTNDPNFASNTSYFSPNVGAGLYYSTQRFYVGLSVPYILENSFVANTQSIQARNYFLTGGYVFDLSPDLKLKPNFLIKYVSGAPISTDLNVNLLIKEVLWIGCSYRMKNSINPLVELLITSKLRFGVAYDIPVSRMAGVYSGSPEVMINYRFVKQKRASRIFSPRYF